MPGKKILVVDDEPDMVVLLTTFLEDNGYQTIAAYDGEEGFEKSLSEKPDLITLDVSMDKESGIRMYRNMHENEETASIPIIMVTGIAPDFQKIISSRKNYPPPAAYFEKPVDKDKLLEKVREIIG